MGCTLSRSGTYTWEDIAGDWNPPHKTHNNGKMVDIGISEFVLAGNSQSTSGWDMDRLLLLKSAIMQDPNFSSFPQNEGGDLGGANTTLNNPRGPHIHVSFKA